MRNSTIWSLNLIPDNSCNFLSSRGTRTTFCSDIWSLTPVPDRRVPTFLAISWVIRSTLCPKEMTLSGLQDSLRIGAKEANYVIRWLDLSPQSPRSPPREGLTDELTPMANNKNQSYLYNESSIQNQKGRGLDELLES
jgi:hypothetical protein